MAKFKGTAAANTIYGTSLADILDGGAGDDTLHGGLGNDTYIVDSTSDVIVETNGTAAGGIDTVITSTSLDASDAIAQFKFIENFTLSGTGDIGVLGNKLNNKIIGNSGNNIIEVGGGSNTVYGGAGNDTIANFSSAVVTNIFHGEDGNDVMNAGYGVSSLFGGNGNDEFITGYGTQVINGGNGNDTYKVNVISKGSVPSYAQKLKNTISLIEASTLDSGTDGVILDASAAGAATFKYTLQANIENLDATTTLGVNLELIGNASANLIYGGGGDDTLSGGTGAEVDFLFGGDGDDTYLIGNSLDTVNEFIVPPGTDQRGIDTIILSRTTDSNTYNLDLNVENIILTNKIVYNIFGNDLDNMITGNAAINALYGNEGNDQIFGGAGNDYLQGGEGDDLLDGGLGADRYLGGLGDDTYVFDNAGDTIQTADLGGIDTIIASTGVIKNGFNTLDLNLSNDPLSNIFTNHLEIENVTLTGKLNISVAGNSLNNNIFGNDGKNDINGFNGNDFIDGGAGNDSLVGNSGFDTLNGGLGNDTLNGGGDSEDAFIFDSALSASNVDLIKFFNGDNKIILDSVVFTKLAEFAGGGIDQTIFVTVSGTSTQGAEGNDYLIYNTSNFTLYYDADAAGGKAGVAFAKFEGGDLPGFSNFEII